MTLPAGARFGPYEVLSVLGAGGMGEVYRARDARLGRDVALKVLPSALSADPDRLQRFRREAQVLASLNHPNIAAIYGIEQGTSVPAPTPLDALVLELVEGQTLADRITAGPLTVDETRGIGVQIAGALEAAHECGIVHRDLKPANIKIRPDGTVKLLDFGLAKALEPPVPDAAGGSSPTFTSPAVTGAGVILGTAAYMSPEQARGVAVDKRTDIWAFGCILFEMLSGRHVFGDPAHVLDAVAAVLKTEPDWQALPADTPSAIRAILKRCLEKDPRRRLRDIGDVGLLLGDSADRQPGSDRSPVVRAARDTSRRMRWAAIGGWSAAVLLAALYAASVLDVEETAPSTGLPQRLALPLASPLVSGDYVRSFDVSDDGRRLVYVGRDSAGVRLYLQDLGTGELKPLPETEDAIAPAFSPDSSAVAFVANRTLQLLRLDGGLPRAITNLPTAEWTWSGPDHVVIAGRDGLQRVPLRGGPPEVIAAAAGGDAIFSSAVTLPGSAYLVTIREGNRTDDPARIELVRPGTSARPVIAERGGSPVFVATGAAGAGHIVYADAGRLWALPFDAARQLVTGAAVPIVENVAMRPNGLAADFDISSAGTLTFREGSLNELVWVERGSGAVRPVTASLRRYGYPRLSPDGKRLGVEIQESPHQVWALDLERDVLAPLTEEPTGSHNFAWAPDGQSIVYTLGLMPPEIGWISTDGSRRSQRIAIAADGPVFVDRWSRAGRLALSVAGPKHPAGPMAMTVQVEGTSPPRALGPPAAVATGWPGSFSPDGAWLAYCDCGASPERQANVSIRHLPSGAEYRVSTESASQPVWAASGRELFFRAASRMWKADVTVEGSVARIGRPEALFAGDFLDTGHPNYDVTADGQRFVMVRTAKENTRLLSVRLHWTDELVRLAPPRP